jgi:metal-responsive CopG/Arc/MetJ family transcriptional regulator
MILPLGKFLYILIEKKAIKENMSKYQFIHKIIGEYFGIKYSGSENKQFYGNSTDLTIVHECLLFSLDGHLHSLVEEEAREENMGMTELICRIIGRHFGIKNSYGQTDKPNPHIKRKYKSILLVLYLGKELHVLLQKEAIKRRQSKFQLIHNILQVYLGIEYPDITARNKVVVETIIKSDQISLHLNDKLYKHLEEKAQKERMKTPQFTAKIIAEYLGVGNIVIARKHYNKFNANMKFSVSMIEPHYKLIEEGARRENQSMSQLICNAIIKCLLKKPSDTEKGTYNPPDPNTKDSLKLNTKEANKFKKISIILDKNFYSLLEKKVEKENTSKVDFIRRAIIEYLLAEYPDMEKELYSHTIRNYSKGLKDKL